MSYIMRYLFCTTYARLLLLAKHEVVRMDQFVCLCVQGCIKTIWPKMKCLVLSCLGILSIWVYMKMIKWEIFFWSKHI